MIIHTVGLEGCGHHGLEPIIRNIVQRTDVYHRKEKLQQICDYCALNNDYESLMEKCEEFFNEKDGVFYIDNSYPSSHKKENRTVEKQWRFSKIYTILNQYRTTRILHLKRNIFNTINSHSDLDGGIISHAKKLYEINNFIESELSILQSNNVEVIELYYEDIPTEKGHKIIASLLSTSIEIVKLAIDQEFKMSTKDYKSILNPETINEISLIFNYPAKSY